MNCRQGDSSVIGSFRVCSISTLSSLEDELLVLQQQSVVDLAATQRPALLDPRGFPRCTFKGPYQKHQQAFIFNISACHIPGYFVDKPDEA